MNQPGDRQLAAWDAQDLEVERVLGIPGAPRPITAEVRSIAAAAERCASGMPSVQPAAPTPAPLDRATIERELAGAFGRVDERAASLAAQPSPSDVARDRPRCNNSSAGRIGPVGEVADLFALPPRRPASTSPAPRDGAKGTRR